MIRRSPPLPMNDFFNPAITVLRCFLEIVGGVISSVKPNVYAISAAAVSSGDSSSSTFGFQREASSKIAVVKPARAMSVVVSRYAVEKSQCASSSASNNPEACKGDSAGAIEGGGLRADWGRRTADFGRSIYDKERSALRMPLSKSDERR
eukprot:CAMPEP_0118923760 /NCGR_PEP_ID=MMETSP1169-20130426/2173_1 /TAXON_ID=36882 /ORGANISM="Pyramimonas obovata, Strain CCMP722" /LENGTH=149 /DNA_ID=CAMNT_0006864797 /DNA_START=313 /DNA_END=758 /DNA_ORIENTATION=-